MYALEREGERKKGKEKRERKQRDLSPVVYSCNAANGPDQNQEPRAKFGFPSWGVRIQALGASSTAS